MAIPAITRTLNRTCEQIQKGAPKVFNKNNYTDSLLKIGLVAVAVGLITVVLGGGAPITLTIAAVAGLGMFCKVAHTLGKSLINFVSDNVSSAKETATKLIGLVDKPEQTQTADWNEVQETIKEAVGEGKREGWNWYIRVKNCVSNTFKDNKPSTQVSDSNSDSAQIEKEKRTAIREQLRKKYPIGT